MGIKSLFTTKKSPVVPAAPFTGFGDTTFKTEGETYEQYGRRLCAAVNGGLNVFNAMLEKIYLSERLHQIALPKKQEELRATYLKEKEEKESEKQMELSRQNKAEMDIANEEDRLTDLKGELAELQNKEGEVNKMARMKLIVGLVVLVPLAVYLYNFYIDAFSKGFEGLMNSFTLYFAPLIFFGLGFALHFFAVQEGWSKYLKIAAVLVFTFLFDCLLAYNIAEMEYNVVAVNSLHEMPPYSLAMAVRDVHVLGVLFCGFIAYIIWGVVFDMSMTAYENMRSNKGEINRCKIKIAGIKEQIAGRKSELLTIKNKITSLDARIKELNTILAGGVFIDYNQIRSALADFRAGWFNMLAQTSLTKEHQEKTQEIYDQKMKTLFEKAAQ